MKKRIFCFVILVSAIVAAHAQKVDRSFFKAGLQVSMPIGDAGDISNFGLGIDLQQHYGVDKILDLGFATGFINYFGKTETISDDFIEVEADFPNIQYVPLAGLVRLYISKGVNFGADVGYALGLDEISEGGFYYRPTLSLGMSDTSAVEFSYTGISDDAVDWSSVNLSLVFLF
ncbi:hypothetical protein [Flavobacterium sp. ASW18X]|uniref:hypothetical protein n=1 Tax=Flavobacterium sp. ASW18X TaxID=2572595 RepID=UPI0010AE727C|nr:hypothetical protein [Flavobacterium sp. ASW18X]TKD57481.1 hypothetical protein FBT53_15175 [Flavobacterium sp. ASW18X]